MLTSVCPECDHDVQMETTPNVGGRVICPSCKTILVVIQVSPVQLDWAFIDPIVSSASNPEDKLINMSL
jgi:Zn-finger nucleic acid-binding protein